MAKRLTDLERNEIVKDFAAGQNINQLSKRFDCTNATIVRNLKKILDQKSYKDLIKKNKILSQNIKSKEGNISFKNNLDKNYNNQLEPKTPDINKNEQSEEELFPLAEFAEITPLNIDIENSVQKDLSSVPISETELPKVVYMIVDTKTELEVKYLKEYPSWQFLPLEEQNRKTIKIYSDQKNAKRFCNKEQKVIKVPNTNVFKIVAPILLNKGISRIVTDSQLISL